MKFLNIFIVIIIYFLSIIFNPLIAAEKTAVVNIDFLIQNSNIGKKVLKNVDEMNKKNIKSLEKKNKSLKNLETEIKKKKNLISEKDFNNEVKIFQNKINEFTNEKNKRVKEFNDFRKTELEKIFNLINPIISNYMKENSINILFDTKNIFMVSPESNLTNKILELINTKIK